MKRTHWTPTLLLLVLLGVSACTSQERVPDRKAAVAGIILEKMSICSYVEEVIDGRNLQRLGVSREDGLQHLPSDSSETVNAYFYHHSISPF